MYFSAICKIMSPCEKMSYLLVEVGYVMSWKPEESTHNAIFDGQKLNC